MAERLTINAVTSETKEWTVKVQVVDKGRPRDNLQKTNKYQLMILQDEEETQVQGIMYGSDIKSYAELFLPYHTYLISVASVTESNHAYGIPINTFLWTIDKGTLIEPIEEVEPPEDSLPPPTRLTVTMFDSFHHQPEGLEFDVLAIVVNVALPTCAANGSRIQELIIMDNQKKPKKLTLWESFIDHVGIYIAEQLNQYPIILARKIAKSKSYAGLTSRFATTIQINPPYPQVAALRKWATSNEQLLIAYTKKSITSTGSLQLIPFEDEIISITDAHQHLPVRTNANSTDHHVVCFFTLSHNLPGPNSLHTS
ncbi:uncharacterized protein [Solanum tuberosum]|uniref:uncharacterized protein n=1 Tax=Solanum tuberosum TaxID=4113 RepID=UPI00073A4017|nr:PREDICTED: uncharacterized protein LOC107059514 [Solanum tuberosum]